MPSYIVTKDEGIRLDVYLVKRIGIPRNQVSKLFDSNSILLNGEISRASVKVKLKDRIKVELSQAEHIIKENDIKIIFEDENVIVFDKPTGMLTHSKGEVNDESTIATVLSGYIKEGMAKTNRTGIVHRLDRLTSGAIIGAKNQETLSYLQKQFSNRKTKKVYIAVVKGIPKNEEAIIDVPLARDPNKPQTFVPSLAGKSAVTHYKVLKTGSMNGEDVSLLELRPETGRTHQLRVHLQHIGHPIIGDYLYGKKSESRMLLHAKSLEITIPGGIRKVFVSDLPKEFNIK